jgi:hypothetical protein
VGTPALLFAAANHPGSFRSLVIGSGATDHKDITGVLDLVVNAPSFETFKDLTGEQFVRGAAANLADYELPDGSVALRLRGARVKSGLHSLASGERYGRCYSASM